MAVEHAFANYPETCGLFMKPLCLILCSTFLSFSLFAEPEKIQITIDRGEDIGQAFGSLFEAKSKDGAFVIGAGFQNAYNTRYRADRHELQFFIRPVQEDRDIEVTELPRPNNTLAGSYLFSRGGVIYSTYGGVKKWDTATNSWEETSGTGGGTNETMQVGDGIMKFGDGTVSFNDEVILEAPEVGNYQLFFYANGYLCFYHVQRGDGPYRPWKNDEDGFSKLYACPWKPGQGAVSLSRATVKTLPVVGETTFAWGVLGDQITTGSNVGGVYVFNNSTWRMIVEPSLGFSYQIYSSLVLKDRLLMGHYPTGRVFEFDGTAIRDIPDWPPTPEGVSKSAREAQTTILYAGEVFAGVWPWGELWRFHPDRQSWTLQQRMFDHPATTTKTVHPYDIENANHKPRNLWGQRVTSLVVNGSDLFVATSAKSPVEWRSELAPWLSPDKWKSYGKVYRITIPGHLSVSTKWTGKPTTFAFEFDESEVRISQDGIELGGFTIPEAWQSSLEFPEIQIGNGIFGPLRGKLVE